MATIALTTFGEYTVGSAPGDWSQTSGTFTLKVQSDAAAIGGRSMIIDTFTASGFRSWGGAGTSVADVEVLTIVKLPGSLVSSDAYFRNSARIDGTGANAYFCEWLAVTNAVTIWKRVANANTSIASTSKTFNAGDVVACRFQVNGTTIQAKWWLWGTAEPGAWDISATDSAVTAAGTVGIRIGSGTTNATYYLVSVAASGATAPTTFTGGATGTGVARGFSFTTDDSASASQAAGTGVAQGFTTNPAALLIGASGTGTTGVLGGSPAAPVPRAFGTGVAGTLTGSLQAFITAAVGVGIAGTMTPSVAVGLIQAAGIGTAGTMTTKVDSAITSAVGIGIAGILIGGPSANPSQAAGIGIAGILSVVVSGSGSSAGAAEGDAPKRRDPRIKTGLVPLERRPAAPAQPPKKPLLPPTEDEAPPLVPTDKPPTPDVPPAAIDAMEEVGLQIMDTQDASDIEAFLRGIEQDEQDAADIADVLALLD